MGDELVEDDRITVAHYAPGASAAPQQVLWFFLITFTWTWSFWALARTGGANLFLGVGAAGPSLAAIILVAREGGRKAVRDLIARVFAFRINPWWYVATVAIPLVAAGLGLAIAWLVERGPFQLQPPFPWWLMPVYFIGGIFVLGPLQEELGWRGYALPRLQRRIAPIMAAIVVGVVWATWHMPLFYMGTLDQEHLPIAPFFIGAIAASVIYAWLYNGTRGSLTPALLFHGATNTVSTMLLIPAARSGDPEVLWYSAGITVAVAISVAPSLGRTRE